MTVRTDRRAHLPHGVNGGGAGSPCFNILNPGRRQRVLPVLPMEGYAVRPGDQFCHVMAGAGGNGDPLVRDPESVLADVLDERITPGYAREIYGVVLRMNGTIVDAIKTVALRRKLSKSKRRPDAHLAHFHATLTQLLGASVAGSGHVKRGKTRRTLT